MEEDGEEEVEEMKKAQEENIKVFRQVREEALKQKTSGPFKDLFGSKGFIWIANRPDFIYNWS